MKKGRLLERTIWALERALLHNKEAQVLSPYKTRDKVDGQLREFDVVVKIQQTHHEFTLALECRDRSRPVTKGQVEAYWKKCQDCGLDQCGIVSTKGFCKSAENKAQQIGVRCLSLEKLEKLEWLEHEEFTAFMWRLVNLHCQYISAEIILQKDEPFKVFQDGQEITLEMLKEFIQYHLPRQDFFKWEVGKHSYNINLDPIGMILVNSTNSMESKVLRICFTVAAKVTSQKSRLDKFIYKETSTSKTPIQTAKTKFDFGDKKIDFILYKDSEGDPKSVGLILPE